MGRKRPMATFGMILFDMVGNPCAQTLAIPKTNLTARPFAAAAVESMLCSCPQPSDSEKDQPLGGDLFSDPVWGARYIYDTQSRTAWGTKNQAARTGKLPQPSTRADGGSCISYCSCFGHLSLVESVVRVLLYFTLRLLVFRFLFVTLKDAGHIQS